MLRATLSAIQRMYCGFAEIASFIGWIARKDKLRMRRTAPTSERSKKTFFRFRWVSSMVRCGNLARSIPGQKGGPEFVVNEVVA